MARLVCLLDGVHTRGMTGDVTLVIASMQASSKVLDARRRRIPVVMKMCVELFSRVALNGFHLPKFHGSWCVLLHLQHSPSGAKTVLGAMLPLPAEQSSIGLRENAFWRIVHTRAHS